MPELAALANSLKNTLIAKHGLKQAVVIAKLAHEKVLAVEKVQEKRDRGEIG